MSFLEYIFQRKNPDEDVDVLIAILDHVGFEGFIVEDDVLKAFIDENALDSQFLKDSLSLYAGSRPLPFKVSQVPEKNWNADWESNFNPVEIEGIVRIRASFHEVKNPFRHDILIDPKMSFGTGHHETTRLMVQAMLTMDFFGKVVADVGSGTGILAILASQLGAEQILALDIDMWAHNNCLENIQLNKCRNIAVVHGDQSKLDGKRFDIILANINRNVLLDQMGTLSSSLLKGGYLLLSGILIEDTSKILQSGIKYGLNLEASFPATQWTCMKLVRE